MALSVEQFDEFFHELWGHDPFPWQRRLAHAVCTDGWPDFIDLPTASGKTACLDIAVFALACQADAHDVSSAAPRRIFFCVNRRVIVDEAHERARDMACQLWVAEQNAANGRVLCEVAKALRKVAGTTPDKDTPPLDVAMLRGGIVRDNRWTRSITQPTIITSTVDQVGSRLLFRGYGVTPEAAPLHSALIAHDSMIMLDEAHISQPFVQTLDAVRRYCGELWSEQAVCPPFRFVQMSATPGIKGARIFRLDDADRHDCVLAARHGKAKTVELCVAAKAKGRNATTLLSALSAELADTAVELQDDKRRNVAIIVNRIATAREVYRRLLLRFQSKNPDTEPAAQVELAIGCMRPLDREDLTNRIQQRVGKARPKEEADGRPLYVVATQCLEVGADFDFDVMVSECASLDALRQRFGRLNRTGRDIDAGSAIIIAAQQVKSDEQLDTLDEKGESDDPIYGNALARTWNWLRSIAVDNRVDFAVNALTPEVDRVETFKLLAPRTDAPVMLPAHVDMWVQTSPTPATDPDVSLFLHGPQRGQPEVNVCWRDDLPEETEDWAAIVSLCPPSSPECMPVPINVIRAWLSRRDISDEDQSDLLDEAAQDQGEDRSARSRQSLIWRGTERSAIAEKARDVKPGDTLVLRVADGGWDIFGHIPDDAPKDIAECAFRQSRGRALLRLYPSRLNGWGDGSAIDQLNKWVCDEGSPQRIGQIRELLQRVADLLPDECANVRDTLDLLLTASFDYSRYPNGAGVVLQGRQRLRSAKALPLLPPMDDGDDAPSCVLRDTPVALSVHLRHVREEVDRVLACLSINELASAICVAADLHDVGKADERFQALLINGDRDDAAAQPMLWAKSAAMPLSTATKRMARRRSGLPECFRHELLSVQLLELATGPLPNDAVQRDLVLHLVASHHGRARPFAPVVLDDDPPDVTLDLPSLKITLTADQRRELPLYRLDSGVSERFWELTRRFGWWGLAYLEAILRLADQQASALEDAGEFREAETDQCAEASA